MSKQVDKDYIIIDNNQCDFEDVINKITNSSEIQKLEAWSCYLSMNGLVNLHKCLKESNPNIWICFSELSRVSNSYKSKHDYFANVVKDSAELLLNSRSTQKSRSKILNKILSLFYFNRLFSYWTGVNPVLV